MYNIIDSHFLFPFKIQYISFHLTSIINNINLNWTSMHPRRLEPGLGQKRGHDRPPRTDASSIHKLLSNETLHHLHQSHHVVVAPDSYGVFFWTSVCLVFSFQVSIRFSISPVFCVAGLWPAGAKASTWSPVTAGLSSSQVLRCFVFKSGGVV